MKYRGTDAVDTFVGGNAADVAYGFGGDDTLSGGGGADVLAGGDGRDTLDGGNGDDWLFSADLDRDYYSGDPVGVVIDTGAERDTLTGGAGSDRLYAGYGDDVDGGSDGYYGDYLYISFQGATAGITADFGLATQVIGGGTITGIENLSWVQGSEFDDMINARDLSGGYTDFTTVLGMGGDDHLIAGYYTDVMDGGDGDDVVDGRSSQYLSTLLGGDGNDTLYTATNVLAEVYGGIGNDVIYASGQMRGGVGNDRIYLQGGYYSDTAYGDDGNDLIDGRASYSAQLIGGAGADRLWGGAGADRLSSGGGDSHPDPDSWTVDSDYAPDRGREHDVLIAGNGDDRLWAGYGDDVDGGEGNDRLSLSLGGARAGVTLDVGTLVAGPVTIGGSSIENIEQVETVWGSDFADRLTAAAYVPGLRAIDGGAGDDVIDMRGQLANLTLTGGAGRDEVHGGAGGDIIVVHEGDLAAGEIIDGGTGKDRLEIDAALGADLTGVTVTGIEEIFVGGTLSMTAAQLDALSVISAETVTLTTAGSITLRGTDLGFTQVVLSDAGNTVDVRGMTGYFATISGGAGADTIFGATIHNEFTGGGGDDRLYGNGSEDYLSGDAGNDIIRGGAGNDRLSDGDGRDRLFGDAGDDVLIVAAGSVPRGETLDGGDGFDTLSTNDACDISGATVSNIEMLDGFLGVAMTVAQLGQFSILSTPSITLTTGGSAALRGVQIGYTEFRFADADTVLDLRGAIAGDTSVDGGGGDDTITGGTARDRLSGGDGADTLRGGAGDDLLAGGVGRDQVFGEAGDDVIGVRAGEIVAGERLDGGVGDDTLSITNLSINERFDLSGATLSGIETLESWEGVIQLTASQLQQFAVIDAWVSLTTGGSVALAGIDFRGAVLILSDQATTLDMRGVPWSPQVIGGAGDDVVTGSARGDTIFGGEGADLLNGGDGSDELHGGAGADRLYGGSGSNDLYGEAGDDILVGGARLSSFGSLSGGTGNDRYYTNGYDAILEYANGGHDTVYASIDFLLDPYVEDLVLRGDATRGYGNELDNRVTGTAHADQLYGGDGNDTLVGGLGDDQLAGEAGDDVLNGLAGADAMTGGAGNDTYYVDAAGDQVIETENGGIDTVRSSVDFTLSADVENLVVLGSADGVGNALDNRLTGSGDANVLAGAGGNDRLFGGGGADRLDGGAGNDLLSGGAARDVLTGGGGADRFVFDDGETAATRAGADEITDFDRSERDLVDLHLIDAQISVQGDQAFHWIGAGAFSGAEGELRLTLLGPNTYLEGDVDGDGRADLVVHLDGVLPLTPADVVL